MGRGAVRRGAGILLAALWLPMAGCSGDPTQQAVISTAVDFVAQTAGNACELLAPSTAQELTEETGKACPVALKDLALPRGTTVRRSELAGEMALVEFDEQTVFLAHFPNGWRVRAAGCRRVDLDPAIPYDCQVEP